VGGGGAGGRGRGRGVGHAMAWQCQHIQPHHIGPTSNFSRTDFRLPVFQDFKGCAVLMSGIILPEDDSHSICTRLHTACSVLCCPDWQSGTALAGPAGKFPLVQHNLLQVIVFRLCCTCDRENVGGSVLEKVLNICKNHARIVACGMVR